MKILVVGLGSAGQRHARNLRAILGDQVELIAFRQRGRDFVINPDMTVDCGRDPESEYGIRRVDSFERALEEKPDAVVIATPNHLHVKHALPVAENGCHLFIEKPIADSLEGLVELAEAVADAGVVGFVGYQLRFHPGWQLLHEVVSSGRIGNLVGVRHVFGEYLPGWHPYEDYREYHAARSEQGGGVLLSQIHDLDLMYSLFGLPERVMTVGGHISELEIDVEDVASTLMEFSVNGRPLPVSVHQDLIQRPPQRCTEIIGDRGRLEWDYFGKRLRVWAEPFEAVEEQSFHELERNDLFLAEMRHFLRCIEEGESPEVTVRDGINSLKIALAARESLASGQPVAVSG